MVASVEFKIEGIDSLIGKLRAVSYDLKFKGGRSALRAAARVVVEAAKANAERIDDPESAESISRNIAARWDGNLYKRTGDLGFRVGVLGGAQETKGTKKAYPGGDTFHWRFIEFGTSTIPAAPFMRPALADNIDRVTTTFVTTYEKSIDRALKRAQKVSVK
jgi:HK97 gp10 family phage protein